jgi:hypothetical protein
MEYNRKNQQSIIFKIKKQDQALFTFTLLYE